MEAQIAQQHTAGRGTTAAVCPAVDMETVQMLVTPGKQDLQKHMQVRQGHITPDKHPTPDEWADTSEDDAELVNAE